MATLYITDIQDTSIGAMIEFDSPNYGYANRVCEWHVSLDGDFQNIVYSARIGCVYAKASQTFFEIGGLTPGETYYLRVIVDNITGSLPKTLVYKTSGGDARPFTMRDGSFDTKRVRIRGIADAKMYVSTFDLESIGGVQNHEIRWYNGDPWDGGTSIGGSSVTPPIQRYDDTITIANNANYNIFATFGGTRSGEYVGFQRQFSSNGAGVQPSAYTVTTIDPNAEDPNTGDTDINQRPSIAYLFTELTQSNNVVLHYSVLNLSGYNAVYYQVDNQQPVHIEDAQFTGTINLQGISDGSIITITFSDRDDGGTPVGYVASGVLEYIPVRVEPQQFEWTEQADDGRKRNGGKLVVSAVEWNSFCARVHEWEEYKGVQPQTVFQDVSSGGLGFNGAVISAAMVEAQEHDHPRSVITAAIVNNAIDAINNMLPTGATSIPRVSRGTPITNEIFNTMMDKMNGLGSSSS